jgi:hypothetical protein
MSRKIFRPKINETGSEALSCNHFCGGKAISVTCSERVSVVLHIQHEKRMHPIILSSDASLAVPHFSTFPHTGKIFGNKLLNKNCVFILSEILSKMVLILRRIQQGMTVNVHMSSRKVFIILVILQ